MEVEPQRRTEWTCESEKRGEKRPEQRRKEKLSETEEKREKSFGIVRRKYVPFGIHGAFVLGVSFEGAGCVR